MKVAVTATIRNGILFQYREKHGLSQRECAEQAGVSATSWCAAECMRFEKLWPGAIRKIAEFVGVNVEELVPAELRGKNVGVRLTRYSEMPPDRLLSIDTKAAMMLPAPEPSTAEIVDQAIIRDRIEEVINQLTFREREIVKARYGIGYDGNCYTYEQCAQIFKITRERARQIEQKALRKLSRTQKMAALNEERR